jgi:NAD(P)-dependent dehydrogenase (short-subunit alcohol dehydrogenase family)
MNFESKTILVTGATDGIGKQTALELARLGARVLVHGRDKDKGARVLDELNRETCNEKLALYIADFSSLADVRRMAADVKREQSHLEILINNAGNFYKERQLSQDGFEMTWAVNHLAPFLLANLLLDLVKESAPARIITVASSAHYSVKAVDWHDLQAEGGYDGSDAYALSKLANICTMNELARRLQDSQVTVNSLHPGVIDTKLLRNSYALDGASVEEGAQTSVYLASSPEVEGLTGKYFSRMREKTPSELVQDLDNQKKFWGASMQMVEKFM